MKKVLFLDDDKSLCYLMIELYGDNKDVEMTTVNSYAQFIKNEPEIHSFDVIFLDVNLGAGKPSGLDVFQWLQERGVNKKIVFFTGHAQAYPEVKNAMKLPNVFVLEKPATIAQIEDLVMN